MIKTSERGTYKHGNVSGYEFVKTIVDKDGNLVHIFKKVTVSMPKVKKKCLANTGATETNSGLAGLGLAILGLAVAAKRRRNK